MKRLCLFLFSSVIIISVYSQKIKGKVEYGGNGVEFANIVLKKQDSLYLVGTVTDSMGAFVFEDVEEGKYIIEISHLGFIKQCINIEKISLDQEPLFVLLQPDNIRLNEVEITSVIPLLTKKNNLIQMQVQNSFLENFPSVPAILSFMPGIIVQSTGIHLFGKEGLLILIDNREVVNYSEIENLSIKSIKNISLEKNAGVKYDSKYKSVLRITTKSIDGNMIELSHNSSIGRRYSNSENIDIKYNKGKTFLSFQGSTRFRNNENNYFVDLINSNTDSKYHNKQSILNNRKSYDLSFGIKHYFHDKHSIQIINDFNLGTNKPTSLMETSYIEDSSIERIATKKKSDYNERNNRLNIIYDAPIRGSNKFELNFDYINKLTTDKQTINENNELDSNKFDIHYNGNYHVIRSRIDFNFNTWKFADINVGGTILLVNNTTKTHSNSNDTNDKYFNYNKLKERNVSYYVSLQKNFKNNSIQLGLRNEVEYFRNFYINSDSLSERRINSFFPYVSIDFNPCKNFNFSITYNRKMDLPAYQQMNTIVTYFDKYAHSIGNSELKPVFYNNISINAFLFNSLHIFMEQSLINNKIIEVPIQKENSNKEVIYMPINIDLIKSSTFNVHYSKSIKKHRIDIGGGLLLQKTNTFLEGSEMCKTSKPAFYFSTHYGYKIINAYPYLKVNYFSKYGDLVSTNSSSLNFSIGCNLNLLDKRLTMSVLVNDIFKTASADWKTMYYPIENLQINDIDSRYISLSVKYMINSLSTDMKKSNINDILNRL